MKFHKEFRFEAPLADVYAMLADPAFREKVAAAAGADSYEVTVTPDLADGFASVVETQQSSRDLPGIARKFLGDEYTIRAGGDLGAPRRGRARRHHPRRLRRDRRGGLAGRGRRGHGPDLRPRHRRPHAAARSARSRSWSVRFGNLLKLQSRVGDDWLAGNR